MLKIHETYQATPPLMKKILATASATILTALVLTIIGATFLYLSSSGPMHIAGLSSLGLSAAIGATVLFIGGCLCACVNRAKRQEEQGIYLNRQKRVNEVKSLRERSRNESAQARERDRERYEEKSVQLG